MSRTLLQKLRPKRFFLSGALLRHGLFLAGFAIYGLLMTESTLEIEWTQALTEAPLLLCLSVWLQAPLRARWWRPLVAALPLACLYGVHDAYLVMLGTVANFADFALLPDLFIALNPWKRIGAVALIALPIVLWLTAVEWRLRRPRPVTALLTVAATLLLAALLYAPGSSYETINAVTPDEEWSDKLTAIHWGRLYSALMREARRGVFSEGLHGFTPLARSPLLLDKALLRSLDRRNVHMVVLESFVDLRRLRGVRFSDPPMAPKFTAWADPYIGSSISAVFGGETARAEFELLCGVPSLRYYGLEFLGFTGTKTYCLPTILSKAGYRTVLTFPHGPFFFNTRRAYPGLGFQQIIYADRFSKPGQESIKLGDQDYLFDGDLFPQNLEKVRALVQEGRPFLNYLITTYGHWPFEIETSRHPLRIKVSPRNEDLEKIANQMLDRTEALDDFIKGLHKVDPSGIILLVADHLPPLPHGTIDYIRLSYQSRFGLDRMAPALVPYEGFLLVIVGGQPTKLPLMRHFDLPRWVLDQLSHGAYCQRKRCDFGRLPVNPTRYLDQYKTILGLATSK